MARKVNTAAALSGVHTLELRYTPIFNPVSKEVLAYRTKTVVYSLELGTLTEPDYVYAVDHGNNTGVKLSIWNISEAIAHINKLEKAGKNFEFVTAKCTSSFADLEDAYAKVRELMEKGNLKNPAKLCLEFPQTLLYLSGDNAKKAILDLKLLGVKTMLSGCGANDCPVSKLLEIPVDDVLLEPATTSLVHDRNKPDVLLKFCQYLKSMNLGVYAEAVENDDDLFSLRRLDILGITCADSYEGTVEQTEGDITLEEILSQAEDDG